MTDRTISFVIYLLADVGTLRRYSTISITNIISLFNYAFVDYAIGYYAKEFKLLHLIGNNNNERRFYAEECLQIGHVSCWDCIRQKGFNTQPEFTELLQTFSTHVSQHYFE